MNRIGKIRIACFILVFLGSLMFGMLSGHAVVMNENIEEGKGICITTIKYANMCSTGWGESWTNPEDACIAEHQHYDGTYHNGSYNGDRYDAHWSATKVNDEAGTSASEWHWFDVDLGGTYNIANVALSLSCGDESNEDASNKIRCHVQLYNAAGEHVGTFYDNSLNITGIMNKYFLNNWENDLTNIKKIRVHIMLGLGGSSNNTTNIYFC